MQTLQMKAQLIVFMLNALICIEAQLSRTAATFASRDGYAYCVACLSCGLHRPCSWQQDDKRKHRARANQVFQLSTGLTTILYKRHKGGKRVYLLTIITIIIIIITIILA